MEKREEKLTAFLTTITAVAVSMICYIHKIGDVANLSAERNLSTARQQRVEHPKHIVEVCNCTFKLTLSSMPCQESKMLLTVNQMTQVARSHS